ncbi:MAG: hypothetical protein ACRDJW_19585, partial [Thermomicrobiales bacterium]
TAKKELDLALKRLLDDQPRAQAGDRLDRVGVAIDAGEPILQLGTETLARNYPRPRGVPPTRRVRSERRLRPPQLFPGSWECAQRWRWLIEFDLIQHKLAVASRCESGPGSCQEAR